ncbi:hypothetical protein NDU88_001989, partial [Pleurodeles waltl]
VEVVKKSCEPAGRVHLVPGFGGKSCGKVLGAGAGPLLGTTWKSNAQVEFK